MSQIAISLTPTLGSGPGATVGKPPVVVGTALFEMMRGPAGADGSGGISIPFAWGDASPRTIATALAGKLVYGVEIHISDAFDGAGASLTVGDAAQPDRLMATHQIDPSAVGAYETSPSHRYGSNTALLLTITPGGGATAGAGLLRLFVET
jgi:hypothetical protein